MKNGNAKITKGREGKKRVRGVLIKRSGTCHFFFKVFEFLRSLRGLRVSS